MNTHADKTQENKSQSVTNAVSQKQSASEPTFQFVDNRLEAITQRKLQEMVNSSPQAKQTAQLQSMADNHSLLQQPIQKKENKIGLPDNLKTGIENLSGYSMDDVKVHYNSSKPAQLQAHAYAQGTDIHLGSGQEKHLPHEAWHVIQKKQGRVKSTLQMKGGVDINDDAGLEKEANVMGAKASTQFKSESIQTNTSQTQHFIQLMKWSTNKRKQPNVGGSQWSDAEIEEVQELYEWCKNITQFNKIIAAITYDDWCAVESFIKDDNWVEFNDELASLSSSEEILELFQYFKIKNTQKRVLKTYDETTYDFPSEKAKELVVEAEMTLQDLQRGDLQGYVGTLAIHDKEYSKHAWEKQANSQVLTKDERPLKNAEIRSALEKMEIAVGELLVAKKHRDEELAAIKLHNDSVAAMVIEAATLPSFTGVTSNALAKDIWEASVVLAGKTGYLEVDTTVYPKATVTTATAFLRTFSFAWTEKYSLGEYLKNPHCPGGGNPSNKTGHSNEESRTSIYQANFIATWGGKDTVIHINSDSI